MPPSLHIGLRRKGASIGIPVHGQAGVIVPQSLRLSGGLHQSHIEFCGRDEEKVKALEYVGGVSEHVCRYISTKQFDIISNFYYWPA